MKEGRKQREIMSDCGGRQMGCMEWLRAFHEVEVESVHVESVHVESVHVGVSGEGWGNGLHGMAQSFP